MPLIEMPALLWGSLSTCFPAFCINKPLKRMFQLLQLSLLDLIFVIDVCV